LNRRLFLPAGLRIRAALARSRLPGHVPTRIAFGLATAVFDGPAACPPERLPVRSPSENRSAISEKKQYQNNRKSRVSVETMG